MVEYKLVNGNITEDGHTMFMEDVLKRLERLDFLEKWKKVEELAQDIIQTIDARKNKSDIGTLVRIRNYCLKFANMGENE